MVPFPARNTLLSLSLSLSLSLHNPCLIEPCDSGPAPSIRPRPTPSALRPATRFAALSHHTDP